MQYKAYRAGPEAAADLGMLKTKQAEATVGDMKAANKRLWMIKANITLPLLIHAILGLLRIVGWVDEAFAEWRQAFVSAVPDGCEILASRLDHPALLGAAARAANLA